MQDLAGRVGNRGRERNGLDNGAHGSTGGGDGSAQETNRRQLSILGRKSLKLERAVERATATAADDGNGQRRCLGRRLALRRGERGGRSHHGGCEGEHRRHCDTFHGHCHLCVSPVYLQFICGSPHLTAHRNGRNIRVLAKSAVRWLIENLNGWNRVQLARGTSTRSADVRADRRRLGGTPWCRAKLRVKWLRWLNPTLAMISLTLKNVD